MKNAIKFWIGEFRRYGFKVASGNMLISFTKWYVGAKRIQLTYKKGKNG